jgi:hypothetical protein
LIEFLFNGTGHGKAGLAWFGARMMIERFDTTLARLSRILLFMEDAQSRHFSIARLDEAAYASRTKRVILCILMPITSRAFPNFPEITKQSLTGTGHGYV